MTDGHFYIPPREIWRNPVLSPNLVTKLNKVQTKLEEEDSTLYDPKKQNTHKKSSVSCFLDVLVVGQRNSWIIHIPHTLFPFTTPY
jgi:hypothetical protein